MRLSPHYTISSSPGSSHTFYNIPQYDYMMRPPRSEYLMSARRADHVFPVRVPAIDQPRNYTLKRDLLTSLASLSIRSSSPPRSDSSAENSPQKVNSSRYKTELCRPYDEQGFCKYGDKCQFAHGIHELRNLARHPKYKTELCRTYHTVGFCPYGPRCHFVHEEELRSPKPSPTKRVPESTAYRNLFEYGSYPLSVSLGSAGDFSPTNSLSTSPVLSPAFSEELVQLPWPVLDVPPPQQVPCDRFQPRHTETDSSDDRLPIFRRLSVEDQ